MKPWQKIAAALSLVATVVVALVLYRECAMKAEASAYDVAKSKEYAAPLLREYGITINDGGRVAKEGSAVAFYGTGKDASGNKKDLIVRFRSMPVIEDGKKKIAVGVSYISIGGREVFRGRAD